jgi:glycerate 2-kinase
MMRLIQNSDSLSISPERTVVLELIESALQAIQPTQVLQKRVSVQGDVLAVGEELFNVSSYERVFVVGFGKGSSGICKILEQQLGEKLTAGWDIDVVDETFSKIRYTKGTHPLPSQINIDYTEQVLAETKNLTTKDLMLVVVCGGGSAMFESPLQASLETLHTITSALLKSGATISEINVIRKHLSKVKGGAFAKHVYPATVVTLIFSDVPGSDLSIIASGPTVQDKTTLEEAMAIVEKYGINKDVPTIHDLMSALPNEESYFENVHNILVVSNQTALDAMKEKATEMRIPARIYSNALQGDAKTIGKELIAETRQGEILLVGGETTVQVTGNGKGGRNQTLVLAALPYLHDGTVLASFDSDGQDFYFFAGAIGDEHTLIKAIALGFDVKTFLDNDNSYEFFNKIGDGIYTDKLASNVSDLMIVYKP